MTYRHNIISTGLHGPNKHSWAQLHLSHRAACSMHLEVLSAELWDLPLDPPQMSTTKGKDETWKEGLRGSFRAQCQGQGVEELPPYNCPTIMRTRVWIPRVSVKAGHSGISVTLTLGRQTGGFLGLIGYPVSLDNQ